MARGKRPVPVSNPFEVPVEEPLTVQEPTVITEEPTVIIEEPAVIIEEPEIIAPSVPQEIAPEAFAGITVIEEVVGESNKAEIIAFEKLDRRRTSKVAIAINALTPEKIKALEASISLLSEAWHRKRSEVSVARAAIVKEVQRAILREGLTETQAADAAKVSRMTIRKWIGK